MATTAKQDPFPAPRRHFSSVIQGISTEVSRTDFADKILVTISQEGRLSQWIQVPLTSSSAGQVEMSLPSGDHSLLPSIHLTPKTILGGGGEQRETLGQLYAAQIGSQLSLKDPRDGRILVVGLGLLKAAETDREGFFDLLDLVRNVL